MLEVSHRSRPAHPPRGSSQNGNISLSNRDVSLVENPSRELLSSFKHPGPVGSPQARPHPS